MLQSRKSEKTAYRMNMQIPKDLKPGKYKIIFAGDNEYGKFLRKVESHKYMARDVDSLVAAVRNIVAHKRDRLHMLLQLPNAGITIEGNELANLPDSKAMLLRSATRSITSLPMGNWIEQSKTIPQIAIGGKVMEITVE